MAAIPRPRIAGGVVGGDQAVQDLPDPGMAVVPIVAVHGTQAPWGKVITDGYRS